jgi:MOSC domain-containing protein
VKSVSRLSIAPVKGMALVHPDEIELGARGVAGNREFFLVDERRRKFDQIEHGPLGLIRTAYDAARGQLTLRFPDGTTVESEVQLGEEVAASFSHGTRTVRGRLVNGAFADAVSEYVGTRLALVKPDVAAELLRRRGPVTILSDASVEELARQAGREWVDARRFRMLISLAGCSPHEEDAWTGRSVRVGDAIVRVQEEVDRCAVTSQDPETGRPDLDTLRTIGTYRGIRRRRGKNRIDFGVFGEIEQPGRVRVGDAVEPL